MGIGSNIKKFRTERRLSQEYLAEELGVSRQAVSKWETGQTEPTAKNLLQLAQLFGVTVSELVGEQTAPPEERPAKRTDLRLGYERFVLIAFSGAMVLSTIETSDPGFPMFCIIMAFIPAILMGINILRLPAQIRLRIAMEELCYCILLYCMVTFLEPIIRNVYTAILITTCCVIYMRYFRFRHINA
jgi:transcriptional regulator with XRE-family HTH domain